MSGTLILPVLLAETCRFLRPKDSQYWQKWPTIYDGIWNLDKLVLPNKPSYSRMKVVKLKNIV